MKKLLLVVALGFAVFAAQAQQYTIGQIACTNIVYDNVTQTSNMGSAVTVTRYDEIGVQASYQCSGAETGNTIFTFVGSVDGTNYATTSPWSMSVLNNGNTLVCTNATFNVGAVGYIKLLSIQCANTDAVNVTNITVRYSLKPSRRD
jgi:hypothetical protein